MPFFVGAVNDRKVPAVLPIPSPSQASGMGIVHVFSYARVTL
jgi:hypothetical protein